MKVSKANSTNINHGASMYGIMTRWSENGAPGSAHKMMHKMAHHLPRGCRGKRKRHGNREN